MQEATLDCKTPWTAVRLVAKVWGSENGSRGGGGRDGYLIGCPTLLERTAMVTGIGLIRSAGDHYPHMERPESVARVFG